MSRATTLVAATERTVTVTMTACAASCYSTVSICAGPSTTPDTRQSYSSSSSSSREPSLPTTSWSSSAAGHHPRPSSEDNTYGPSATRVSSPGLPVPTASQSQSSTDGHSSTRDACGPPASRAPSSAHTGRYSSSSTAPHGNYTTGPGTGPAPTGIRTSSEVSSKTAASTTFFGPGFPTVVLPAPTTHSSGTISYQSSADATGTSRSGRESRTNPAPTTFVTTTKVSSSEDATSSTEELPPSYGSPTNGPPSYDDPPSYSQPPSYGGANVESA